MGDHFADLNRWFETPLGRRLLSEEACALQQVLPHLFGYHLLQVGSIGHGYLLESSRIMHRCILTKSGGAIISKPYTCVLALADTIPFAHHSLDVVVLPHILEFEENPHEILREVERILIPEGHLVILGFNPMSLWGLRHWLSNQRKTVPWCGRFLPLLRIKDWLALLNFEVKQQQTFFFALPFYRNSMQNYTKFMDKIGLRWTNNLGAVYMLVAKKRVITLTPIKPSRWLAQPALVTSTVTSFQENH